LCTTTPLFKGVYLATEEIAQKARNCFLRRAANVVFSKFRLAPQRKRVIIYQLPEKLGAKDSEKLLSLLSIFTYMNVSTRM